MDTREQLSVINQQIKELTGVYRGAIVCSGVSENEFWIWYALTILEGELTQQDICGMWSLSKQTVNTIVANMTRRGYAVLEAIPGKRNCKRICLTEAGRAYGREIVLPVFNAEKRAAARMSEEDRALGTAILGRYISMLKEEIHGI